MHATRSGRAPESRPREDHPHEAPAGLAVGLTFIAAGPAFAGIGITQGIDGIGKAVDNTADTTFGRHLDVNEARIDGTRGIAPKMAENSGLA
ncbi:hypothetical protein ACFY3N_16780 [Streptomyces sp. NPDC000348]|uniref:hypothetical protein n=1 Tax=Streptomyces sp. NPDC000348 TaxID=3364538 RepID=UPI003676AAFD